MIKTYEVIKGNSLVYIENQLNYYSEQYKKYGFTVHGGINNYNGYYTVLVSYIP